MGNDMGRTANRMAIGAMANATHFEKKELLRLQASRGFNVCVSSLCLRVLSLALPLSRRRRARRPSPVWVAVGFLTPHIFLSGRASVSWCDEIKSNPLRGGSISARAQACVIHHHHATTGVC